MKFESRTLTLLNSVGALIEGSHTVLKAGDHSDSFLNKDGVYPYTGKLIEICGMMSEMYADEQVDGVIGAAVAGVAISQRLADGFCEINGKQILSIYADKESDPNDPTGKKELCVLRRGYEKFIPGRHWIVGEDVLTTGGTVKQLVELVQSHGGKVVGVAGMFNRGNVTSQDVGAELRCLVTRYLKKWPAADCHLCRDNVPINTSVGKGKAFLEAQAALKATSRQEETASVI